MFDDITCVIAYAFVNVVQYVVLMPILESAVATKRMLYGTIFDELCK
jgi:hypothetical protein